LGYVHRKDTVSGPVVYGRGLVSHKQSFEDDPHQHAGMDSFPVPVSIGGGTPQFHTRVDIGCQTETHSGRQECAGDPDITRESGHQSVVQTSTVDIPIPGCTGEINRNSHYVLQGVDSACLPTNITAATENSVVLREISTESTDETGSLLDANSTATPKVRTIVTTSVGGPVRSTSPGVPKPKHRLVKPTRVSAIRFFGVGLY
jgi:hypothetical protein